MVVDVVVSSQVVVVLEDIEEDVEDVVDDVELEVELELVELEVVKLEELGKVELLVVVVPVAIWAGSRETGSSRTSPRTTHAAARNTQSPVHFRMAIPPIPPLPDE
jgi:hypothetical protein